MDAAGHGVPPARGSGTGAERRYAQLHERTIDGLASVYARLHERAGTTPRYPARVLAQLELAISRGALLEELAHPGAADLPVTEILSDLVLQTAPPGAAAAIPVSRREGNLMPAELLARQGGSAPAFSDLRGRIQADIFAGLPGHFRRLGLAPDQLRDWQRDRLRRVLATAIQHSAFPCRRLRGVDAARFELADLPSLPVMTKAQMINSSMS